MKKLLRIFVIFLVCCQFDVLALAEQKRLPKKIEVPLELRFYCDCIGRVL